MKQYNIFYIIIFLLVSCNNKKNLEKISPVSDSENLKKENVYIKEAKEIPQKQGDTISSTDNVGLIVKFLSFYQQQYDFINDSDFLDMNSENYKVDFTVVNSYLNKLDSIYLDYTFKSRLLDNFKKIDLRLQSSSQNDGIPEGLEFDMILKTQEVDEILDMIKKKKYTIKPYKAMQNIYTLNISNLHCLQIYLKEDKISEIKLCD